jgi:hypothetical protein
MSKMVRYKLTKKWVKNDQKWRGKIGTKNCSKINFSRGGPAGSKSSKIDLGGPGPQKQNFLKFPHFLQKLSTFGPPKSTPIKGPIGKPIPHK